MLCPAIPSDSDLLGKLSAMYANQAEKHTPPKNASVVADRQANSLAKSLGRPASSSPRQNTFTITPRALPSNPQRDSDLLGKLSAMYSNQAEKHTPAKSRSVVADRQANSLAKSLSLPVPSPSRRNTFTITPRVLPSNLQRDSDLLGKLSALYAEQAETRTPPKSGSVVADRQANSLAKSLGATASPPRKTTFTIMPPARPSNPQRDSDLLGKLSAMYADQGEPEVEPPSSFDAPQAPSPELSASDGALAQIPSVETPSEQVRIARRSRGTSAASGDSAGRCSGEK